MRYIYMVSLAGTDYHNGGKFRTLTNLQEVRQFQRRYGKENLHVYRMSRWLYRDGGGTWDAPTFRIMADRLA